MAALPWLPQLAPAMARAARVCAAAEAEEAAARAKAAEGIWGYFSVGEIVLCPGPFPESVQIAFALERKAPNPDPRPNRPTSTLLASTAAANEVLFRQLRTAEALRGAGTAPVAVAPAAMAPAAAAARAGAGLGLEVGQGRQAGGDGDSDSASWCSDPE
ncbi:hypothetical protein T492DRAFT_843792 [Pavlovales sp. CCMP2436]|nr:hypothetical protein T492DRAFT_843792 [Pavlovales sp. CCMP2436]